MRVTFLNPGSESEPFFGKFESFLRIAASQLGADLEVIACHRQRGRMIAEGESLLERKELPQYLLLGNPEGAGVELLPRLDRAGIKTMMINEAIMAFDFEKVGRPRQKLPNWLGQLVPDDRQAGELLADHLVRGATEKSLAARDGTIHLLALAGDYTSSSNLRVVGLNRVVKARQDVTVNAVRLGDWDRGRARELTASLLEMFPQTSVVWAASDLMAAGAIEALEAAGREPGGDVLVGGVDWAPQAYERIRNGTLAASVGGHFMQGAWALVMLYDHHHGRDFENLQMRSDFVVLAADNLSDYEIFFDDSRWAEADFRRLSRVENPSIDGYDFTPTAAFGQLF